MVVAYLTPDDNCNNRIFICNIYSSLYIHSQGKYVKSHYSKAKHFYLHLSLVFCKTFSKIEFQFEYTFTFSLLKHTVITFQLEITRAITGVNISHIQRISPGKSSLTTDNNKDFIVLNTQGLIFGGEGGGGGV